MAESGTSPSPGSEPTVRWNGERGQLEWVRGLSPYALEPPRRRIQAARAVLGPMRSFTELHRAVERSLKWPNQVVSLSPWGEGVWHNFSPAERGQILSFAWWCFIDGKSWPVEKRKGAFTYLSSLRFFSPTELARIARLEYRQTEGLLATPWDSASRYVIGVCDPWLIREGLLKAVEGEAPFREWVAGKARYRISRGEWGGEYKSGLMRLFGIPKIVQDKTARGVQFVPLPLDIDLMEVCPYEGVISWTENLSVTERELLPRYSGETWVRGEFEGVPLKFDHETGVVFTSVPVAPEGEDPYHWSIPGRPSPQSAERLGPKFFDRMKAWEDRYLLPGLR